MDKIKFTNVLIEWVNCLKLTKPIRAISDLKTGDFFSNLQKLIAKSSKCDTLTFIFNLLSKHYPHIIIANMNEIHLVDIPDDELCLITTLLMHYTCIYDRRDVLTSPLCHNLSTSTQLVIRTFLQKMSSNVTNTTLLKIIKECEGEQQSNSMLSATLDMLSPLQDLLKTPVSKFGRLQEKDRVISGLKSDLELERCEKCDLQQELSAYMRRNDKMKTQMEQKNEEIKRLRSEILELENRNTPQSQNSNYTDNKLLKSEIQCLELCIKKLDDEQEELLKERDASNRRVRLLENESQIWQGKFFDVERNFEVLRTHSQSQDLKVEWLEAECEELRAFLEEYRSKPSNESSLFDNVNATCHSSPLCENLAFSVIEVQLKESLELNDELKLELERISIGFNEEIKNLQEQHSTTQDQLHQTLELNALINTKLSEMEALFGVLKAEKEDLTIQMNEIERGRDEIRTQKETLEKDVESLVESLKIREKDCEELSKHLEESRERSKTQNLELAQLETIRSDLQNQLGVAIEANDAANRQLQQAQALSATLEVEKNNLNIQIDEIRRETNTLRYDFEILQENYRIREVECAKVLENLEQLRESSKSQVLIIADLERAKSEVEDQLKVAHDLTTVTETKYEETQALVATLKVEKCFVEDQINKVVRERDEIRKKNEDLKIRNAEFTKVSKSQAQTIEELEKDKCELQDELKTAQESIDVTSVVVIEFQDLVVSLNTEKEVLEQQMEELREVKQVQHKNLEDLEEKSKIREEEYKELSKHLEELEERSKIQISEFKTLETARSELQVQLTAAIESNNVADNDLKQFQALSATLEFDRNNLQLKINELLRENDMHCKNAETRETEFAKLVKNLENLRDCSKSQALMIADLEQAKSGVEDRLREADDLTAVTKSKYEEIQALATTLKAEKCDLEHEIKKTVGERDDILRKYEILVMNLQKLEENSRIREEDFKELSKHLGDSREKAQIQIFEMEKLQTVRSDLEAQLAAAIESNEIANHQLKQFQELSATLEAEKSNLEVQINEMRKENDIHSKIAEIREAESAKLIKDIENLRDCSKSQALMIDNLEKAKSEVVGRLKVADDLIAVTKSEYEEIQALVATMRGEKEDLEHEVNQIMSERDEILRKNEILGINLQKLDEYSKIRAEESMQLNKHLEELTEQSNHQISKVEELEKVKSLLENHLKIGRELNDVTATRVGELQSLCDTLNAEKAGLEVEIKNERDGMRKENKILNKNLEKLIDELKYHKSETDGLKRSKSEIEMQLKKAHELNDVTNVKFKEIETLSSVLKSEISDLELRMNVIKMERDELLQQNEILYKTVESLEGNLRVNENECREASKSQISQLDELKKAKLELEEQLKTANAVIAVTNTEFETIRTLSETLGAEKEGLEHKIDEIRKENEILKKDRENLSQDLKIHEEDSTEMAENFEAVREHLNYHISKLNEVKKANIKLQDELDAANRLFDVTNTKFEQSREFCTTLEAEKDGLELQLDELRKENELLHKSLQDLQENSKVSKTKCEETIENLKTAKSEVEDHLRVARESIAVTNTEANDIKALFDIVKVEKIDLEQQIEEMKCERDDLQETVKALERSHEEEITRMTKIIEELRESSNIQISKLGELETAEFQLQHQLEAVLQANDITNTEFQQSQALAATFRAERDDLELKNAEIQREDVILRNDIENLQKETKIHEVERANLNENLEALRECSKSQASTIADLEKNKCEVEDRLKTVDALSTDTAVKYEEIRGLVATLKAENHDLVMEVKNLKNERNEIQKEKGVLIETLQNLREKLKIHEEKSKENTDDQDTKLKELELVKYFLEDQIQENDRISSDLKRENDDLNKQIDEIHKKYDLDITMLKDEVESLKSERNETKETILDYEITISSLKSALDENLETLTSLRNNRSILECENRGNDEMVKSILEVLRNYHVITDENDDDLPEVMENYLEKTQVEHDRLKSNFKQALDKFQIATLGKIEVEAQFDDLDSCVSTICDKLDSALRMSRKMCEDSKQKENSSKILLGHLKSDKENVLTSSNYDKSKEDELKKKNMMLKQKLVLTENAKNNLEKKIKQLRDDLKKSNEPSSTDDLKNLRDAYSEVMATKSKLELDNRTLRKLIEERNLQLGDLSLIKEAYERLLEENNKLLTETDTIKYKRARDKDEFVRLLKKERDDCQSHESRKIQEIRSEYEAKLEKMKTKMLQLYREEVNKEVQKIKSGQNGSQGCLMKSVQNLQSDLFEAEQKIQLLEMERDMLKIKQTSENSGFFLRSNHENRPLPPLPIDGRLSTVTTTTRTVGSRGDENRRASTLPRSTLVEEIVVSRRTSINSIPNNIGRNLQMEDEDDHFNNKYLSDLKDGRCIVNSTGRESVVSDSNRFSELAWRNSLVPPHLKSSYPAEIQFVSPARFKDEELKSGNVMEFDNSLCKLLPSDKPSRKKDVGTTSYKKPGPPTPSKNGGRLSLQGNEVHPIREQESRTPKRSTPSRIRALFTSKSSIRDNSESHGTTPNRSKRLNIFRKPK